MTEEFMRDGREPVPASEGTSRSMRSNKGRDTRPEIVLRKALRGAGLSGYRLHWKVPGRPDIAYPGRKVAVFVNGCFWHRCPVCDLPLPKSNTGFWKAKFEANAERDLRVTHALEADGWIVVTVWECEIRRDLSSAVRCVEDAVASRSPRGSKSY